MVDEDEWIVCQYCSNEILDKDATYVEGRPYCNKCYSEAEILTDLEVTEDDDDDDDDDEDDEDEDDDD